MSAFKKAIKAANNPDPVVANHINNLFSVAEIETILENASSTLQDNTFLGMDFCQLMQSIADCGYNTDWFDFIYEDVDEAIVKNIVSQNTEPSYLASVLFENDPKALNKLITLEPDLIADALRVTDNLDINTYLMYLYQRFGRTVFNNVIDDLGGQIDIQKTLTLDELHIYGSARHGIHKPQKRVVRKTYVLEEIDSEGEFAYGAAQDSTIAKISYKFFSRRLTYKQYELSNHLGNVLASILDRKTPQIGNDTLLYYNADVSTANMYYAFGSLMHDLKYRHVTGADTAEYRYGYNNQENEDNLYGEGDAQVYEYRISNSRLGRFFSVDPLAPEYPYYSPYQFAGNMPVWAIELEGLEPSLTTEPTAVGEVSTYNAKYKNVNYNIEIDASAGERIDRDEEGRIISIFRNKKEYVWDSEAEGFFSGDDAYGYDNFPRHTVYGRKKEDISFTLATTRYLRQVDAYWDKGAGGRAVRGVLTTIADNSPQAAVAKIFTGHDLEGNKVSAGDKGWAVAGLVPGLGVMKYGDEGVDAMRYADDVANAAKRKYVLPSLDATGKVHGTLPKAKDFGRYSDEDLGILLKELRQSVQKRIEVTSKMGRDRPHGVRQGQEQDLIKSLEKYLGQ